jgi:DNA-3-methyladenine glycosylase
MPDAMTFELLPPTSLVAEPLAVARRLLGQRLVRRLHGELLVGTIVEVEAYGGREDSTSHARRGSTGRAAGMFGQEGRAYVYLIYGMHACLNVVAHPAGGVGAVLLRALRPELGIERMRELRGARADHLLTSGPGRLCAALHIDRALDGVDLLDPSGPLFLAAGPPIPDAAVTAGPRVGVVGHTEDVARPWRLYVVGDPHVSPGRRPIRRPAE